MAVQSQSNEKNKSQKLNLHYLLLKYLSETCMKLDLENPTEWNALGSFFLCTIPAGTFLVCLNVILFFPLPILRLLQHATIVHNNNSMVLIENTPFLHKYKHLKALNMASHCNLLEMRRKLKSLAVKVLPEFLS